MSSSTKEYRQYLAVEDELRAMLREGKRDPVVVRRQLQAIINQKGAVRPAVPGSELVISLEDCQRFLAEFCGLKDADLSGFKQTEKPQEEGFWPIPCHAELSYPRLAELIAEREVPHYDWVPAFLRERIDADFDCRKAEEGSYLLYTPAGKEAKEACSKLAGKSYRELWKIREEVLTAREAVILWLLVFWKSSGKLRLDRKGWTRTSSRDVGGGGLDVGSGGGRLGVDWPPPDYAYPHGSARFAIS